MKRMFSRSSLRSTIRPPKYEKKISEIAGAFNPSDPEFPWPRLRQYVDDAIKKYKADVTADELDAFIIGLVEKHDRKAVAFAACGHALSETARTSFIQNLPRVDALDNPRFCAHLQLLIAINYHSPTSVVDKDATTARALLRILETDVSTPHKLLRSLSHFIQDGIHQSSRLSRKIVQLFKAACSDLDKILSTYFTQVDYLSALAILGWLPDVVSTCPEGHLDLGQMLTHWFPRWKACKAWVPDRESLQLINDRLEKSSRTALHDIIALDGPSFSLANKSNAREGLADTVTSNIFDFGRMKFQLESNDPQYVLQTLQLVRDTFLNIVATYGDSKKWIRFTEIMCFSCIITESSIRLWRECSISQDEQLLYTVGQILEAEARQQIPEAECVFVLLELLNGRPGPELTKQLGSRIHLLATDIFRKVEQSCRARMATEPVWGASHLNQLEVLHSLGLIIMCAPGCQPYLDDRHRTLLHQWPDKREIENSYSVIIKCQKLQRASTLTLKAKLTQHILGQLTITDPLDPPSFQLVRCLLDLWNNSQKTFRETALAVIAQISGSSGSSNKFCCECIQQLGLLQDDQFVRALKEFVLPPRNRSIGYNCITFAGHLAIHSATTDCWRLILLRPMDTKADEIYQYALQNLTIDEWFSWLDNLRVIFLEEIGRNLPNYNVFLQPSLHDWFQVLGRHVETINQLGEGKHASNPVQRIFLHASVLGLENEVEQILDCFAACTDDKMRSIMHILVKHLDESGSNAFMVCETLQRLHSTTQTGLHACHQVVQKSHTCSPELASAFLASWCQDETLEADDKKLLRAVGHLLDIKAIGLDVSLAQYEQVAAAYLQQRLGELLAEARLLEEQRIAFKARDPLGTKALLEEIGIEDTSPLDDLFAELPPELYDAVEWVSDTVVELHVPLTSLTPLKRRAFGISDAQSLVVRLYPGVGGMMPAFCIHTDVDSKKFGEAIDHSPCLILPEMQEPEEHVCHGRPSPAAFQLSRILWNHLNRSGIVSLETIYVTMTQELKILSSKCIVCGVVNGKSIIRPTYCTSGQCQTIVMKSAVEIHLSAIWEDVDSVELVMALVYAAASAKMPNLLTGCPITDMDRVVQVITLIPPMSTLQQTTDLWNELKHIGNSNGVGTDITKLMSWACTNYQGFLSSATGNLRVPQFPGSHQFLLANAAPAIERNFAARAGRGGTMIVFHGTSWARIYPILCQGLQSMSGTALQANGASLGSGIYVSTDPNTASGYTSAGAIPANNKFANHSILLGCELAGSWSPKSGNIYVITDPTCLIVRYLFLYPAGSALPAAAHITPAISSVCAGLRSGTL